MLVASQVAPGKPQILHWPEMPLEERRRRHGVGTHTPVNGLIAGEPTSITFQWTIGEEPVVDGGELLVVWRWPFDWSDLQSEHPDADGYMKVEFEPGAHRESGSPSLEPSYHWFAGIEPWHHQIQVGVTSGQLTNGDHVRLICGRSNDGGGSWYAPTCVSDNCRFLMLIDHQGDAIRSRLVQQPGFRVAPGVVTRLAAIADSDAVVGEPIEVIVRGEDQWGNGSPLPSDPRISVPRDPSSDTGIAIERQQSSHVARKYQVVWPQTGIVRFQVELDGLVAMTNPCVVHAQRPVRMIYWGDLHSGQSEVGCGCGSIADSYEFGRDCAGLKFMTHQANDHYVTADEWELTRRVTDEYYQPGQFVPILGCEWSPLTKDGGDRNVYYLEDEPVLRRSDRFFREANPDPTPDIPTAQDFHDAFRHRNVLVNIHVGGRMTNLEWYDQQIERLCETHSTHGTVEWFFMDALKRGYRVGLTAGTDGVTGRPGADHPGRRLIRNSKNGLTAVCTTQLTRDAIGDALRNRCCYATTGERIRLEFHVNGQPMGAEIESTDEIHVAGRIEGTAAIERVELFRGVEVIQTWDPSPADLPNEPEQLRILWSGTERKGTARLQRVDWAGNLSVTEGKIQLLEMINFQSSQDQAMTLDDEHIHWTSKTAGNASGIIVRVTGNSSTTQLRFESEPVQFDVKLDEVLTAERTIQAGGVNRMVRIGPPPRRNGPTHFEFDITRNEKLIDEYTPFWLRVTQIDQSIAWSSPVYAKRRGATRA